MISKRTGAAILAVAVAGALGFGAVTYGDVAPLRIVSAVGQVLTHGKWIGSDIVAIDPDSTIRLVIQFRNDDPSPIRPPYSLFISDGAGLNEQHELATRVDSIKVIDVPEGRWLAFSPRLHDDPSPEAATLSIYFGLEGESMADVVLAGRGMPDIRTRYKIVFGRSVGSMPYSYDFNAGSSERLFLGTGCWYAAFQAWDWRVQYWLPASGFVVLKGANCDHGHGDPDPDPEPSVGPSLGRKWWNASWTLSFNFADSLNVDPSTVEAADLTLLRDGVDVGSSSNPSVHWPDSKRYFNWSASQGPGEWELILAAGSVADTLGNVNAEADTLRWTE